MQDIPWGDNAVLIEALAEEGEDGLPRKIVAEGTLRELVDTLRMPPLTDLTKLRISLPDRRAPPYGYDRYGIARLIVQGDF